MGGHPGGLHRASPAAPWIPGFLGIPKNRPPRLHGPGDEWGHPQTPQKGPFFSHPRFSSSVVEQSGAQLHPGPQARPGSLTSGLHGGRAQPPGPGPDPAQTRPRTGPGPPQARPEPRSAAAASRHMDPGLGRAWAGLGRGQGARGSDPSRCGKWNWGDGNRMGGKTRGTQAPADAVGDVIGVMGTRWGT